MIADQIVYEHDILVMQQLIASWAGGISFKREIKYLSF